MKRCGLLALYEGEEYKALRTSEGIVLFHNNGKTQVLDHDEVDRYFVRHLIGKYRGHMFSIGNESFGNFRLIGVDNGGALMDFYKGIGFKSNGDGLYYKDVNKNEVTNIEYREEDLFEPNIQVFYDRMKRSIYGSSIFTLSYPIVFCGKNSCFIVIFVYFQDKLVN